MPREFDSSLLTLDQVKGHVGALPDHVLDVLAQGPLEDLAPEDPGYLDADDCRVCQALHAHGKHDVAAGELMGWHDLVTVSFDLVREMTVDREDRLVVRQVQELIGATSYARCCVIYACAEAELLQRKAIAA